MSYIIKQEGLYQNKVNSSPPATVKWAILDIVVLIDLEHNSG